MILCLYEGYNALFLLSLCCATQLLYFTTFSKGFSPHLFCTFMFLIFIKKRAVFNGIVQHDSKGQRSEKTLRSLLPECEDSGVLHLEIQWIYNNVMQGNSDGVELKYQM